LGREPDALVWIDSGSVSRRHARILVDGERATLEDLGSKNGTFLDGRRIESRTPLSNGSRIKVGSASLVFRCFRRTGTTETEVET
jgi:pSer/pThr/pTyr-binding forkhead associated (FHA) protein